MIVCFCFGRFFCYFLWALGVTLLPLWKSIPDTGPKAIREETVIWKLSSTVWNFPLTAWWRELPGLTTNSILEWSSASSIYQGWTLMYPGSKPECVMSAVFSKKDSRTPCCLQQATDDRNIKGYMYICTQSAYGKKKASNGTNPVLLNKLLEKLTTQGSFVVLDTIQGYLLVQDTQHKLCHFSQQGIIPYKIFPRQLAAYDNASQESGLQPLVGCKTQSGPKPASEIKCQLHMFLQKGWTCCQGHMGYSYNDASPV